MRATRATRALLALTLACLLAAPALAAPDRDRADRRETDRPAWSETVRETVTSLWDRLLVVFRGGKPSGDDDRVPGSGLDPDGHRPSID